MPNLIHIGLPKTATTTLQNNVFARQPRFTYLGKVQNNYPDHRVRELCTRVRLQDSLDYDANTTRSILDELRAHRDKVGDRRPFLLSEEAFAAEGYADRRLIAERLHRLFAPAKVLIVLRAQPSLLKSLYMHHLKSSGERPVTFESWLAKHYGEIRFPGTLRVGLDYENLVRSYEQLFGGDNVVVLAFESIHGETGDFARSVGELVGLDCDEVRRAFLRSRENTRMSERHRLALGVQNILPTGANLALAGRRYLPAKIYEPIRGFVTGGRLIEAAEMPADWLVRLQVLCGSGNAALARRKNIPLATFGYPLP